MNRYTAVLIFWTAVSFYGCIGSQFTKLELETMRTQEMLKTYRAESHSEYEQLSKDLASIQSTLSQLLTESNSNSSVSHELKSQMRDIQTSLLEIEKRLHAFSGTSSIVLPDIPGTEAAKFGDRTPEQFYQTAYNDYLMRKYDLAILEFNDFITAFPESDLVDNAQFWIGEAYMNLKNYEDARKSFELLVSQYQTSDKFTAALLKLGLSHAELGDYTNARRIFRDLINRFPFSEESKTADEQLKRLR